MTTETIYIQRVGKKAIEHNCFIGDKLSNILKKLDIERVWVFDALGNRIDIKKEIILYSKTYYLTLDYQIVM